MRKFSNEDICDKLSMILESIDIIERRTVGISSGFDFMTSFERVTLFDSCVLRLQVIGEEVGKQSVAYLPLVAVLERKDVS